MNDKKDIDRQFNIIPPEKIVKDQFDITDMNTAFERIIALENKVKRILDDKKKTDHILLQLLEEKIIRFKEKDELDKYVSSCDILQDICKANMSEEFDKLIEEEFKTEKK